MFKFNQQHFYDDKSESEKRKSEFYAFTQLINVDPFSMESRDVIDMLSDRIPKEFINMRYTLSFYKSLVDKSNNESNEQYKNAVVSYEQIIKKVNILAKELNLSNSLELSFLFSYLLYNGYFSITGEHKASSEKRLIIPGYFCFDIFYGRGDCLNDSDMLTDILVNAGYQSSMIFNISNSLRKDYNTDIEIQYEEPKLFTKIFSFFNGANVKKIGNHSCTLTIDNDKPYIFDPANITMFECINNKEAVHTLGMGKLVLKPYVSSFLTSNDMNCGAIKNLCLRDDYSSPYTRKDFIFTSLECVERFDSSLPLIKEFRDEMFPYINDIVQDTKVKQKRK